MKIADNRALAAEKKFYIQPITESQETRFTTNICIGSVRSNVNLNYIGNTGEDPI